MVLVTEERSQAVFGNMLGLDVHILILMTPDFLDFFLSAFSRTIEAFACVCPKKVRFCTTHVKTKCSCNND